MKRVLVHCFDPVNLVLIHDELSKKHGFDCEIVRGVREAFDRLRAEENLPTQFDLVITDHVEWRQGCISITCMLKSWSNYKHIPFFFISIDKERFAEEARRSIQQGSEQAFLLPGEIDRLVECVNDRLTK
jgi:CheY-like chemotaxis protein